MKPSRFLSSAAALLLAGTASAGIRAPYTADANTIHLYQFETAAGATIAPNLGTAGRNIIAVNTSGSTTTGTGSPVVQTGILGDSSAAAPGFGLPAKITTATHLLGYDAGGTVDVYEGDASTERVLMSTLGIGVGGATSPFTLEALVRPGSASSNREIICTDSTATTRGFQFRITTGGNTGQRLEFNLIGQASTQRFGEIPIDGDHAWALNDWFHVAFVYDGTNCRFYWTKLSVAPTVANQLGADQAVVISSGTITGPVVLGNDNRAAGNEMFNGHLDQVRISNIARAASDLVFNSNPADSDGDGLLDVWEIQYFGGISAQNGSGDADADGANNEQEETAGSNPTNASSTPSDVDADGLNDTWEVLHFVNINAQNGSGDPDADFSTNELEETAGTNPTLSSEAPDSDGDGLKDGWEILHFGNLAQNASGDFDFDGSNNGAEHAAGSDPKDAAWTATKAKLAHRWSFNGDLTDSVGAATATIVDPDSNSAVGGVVTQSASAITLGGGVSTTSAYVNLGANLVGGKKTPVTIELWATPVAVQNWGRIFDFGSSTTEYLFMSWSRTTNGAQDMVEWVDSGVTNNSPDTNQPYTLGVKYHIVLTLTPAINTAGALTGGTRVAWYTMTADSVASVTARGTFDTANHLANFSDLNNWLGRSMWAGDNVASASYDEVRIWNGALTPAQISTLQLAGPNALGVVDNDSDGLGDTWEILYFRATPSETDAQIIAKHNGTADPDGDSFNNAAEYAAGSNPTVALSTPNDTDADGLPDTWEVSNFGNLAQTASGDFDGDRATNLQEYLASTDPKLNTNWPDADGDSLNDGWEIFYFGSITAYDDLADPDDDSYNNFSEQASGLDPTSYRSSTDSDGDGLPDGWEVHFFKLSGETGLADYASILPRQTGFDDPDADGFINSLEYAFETNPSLASSVPGDLNNDGVNDGPVLKVGGDLINTTSFDNGLNWHDGATPVAGKTYIVFVNGLRTPATGDLTFVGDKLVLTTSGTNTGTLIWKTPGAVTFPLIQFDGGILNQAAGTAAVALNGNALVTRASNLWANNGAILVNAALSGTGDLNLTGGNAVTFAGSSTWKGNLNLGNTAGFTLAPTGNLVFAPGANGVTNAITGTTPATLNGTFNINTSAASTVAGSSWVLVATTGAKTYGATFTVAGYTADAASVGSRKWTAGAYSFDEATGTLSVTAPPLSALETWRQAKFGSSANSGSGADTADFDLDGRVNLVEYALGTDPKVANTGPVTTVTQSGGVLSLTFAHGSDASIGYVIDASPDLVTWTQVQNYGPFTTAGSTTYVDSVTLGAGSRRFLRLRITY